MIFKVLLKYIQKFVWQIWNIFNYDYWVSRLIWHLSVMEPICNYLKLSVKLQLYLFDLGIKDLERVSESDMQHINYI